MTAQRNVLIVDGDEPRLAALKLAITETTLYIPSTEKTGEAGVLAVNTHDIDVCIIAFELPGIDGLETMARIRNRRPEMPVIMVANSDSQQAAISAFRAGVIDFFPVAPGFERAVANVVQAQLTDSPTREQRIRRVAQDPSLDDIPESLLQPTYQNRLRVIGRQLDIYRYHSIVVVEVDGGFMVRAIRSRERTPEALEFPDHDFPWLVRSSIHDQSTTKKQTPTKTLELMPTGYEDFLRALGFRLDEMKAESISITEFADCVGIQGRSDQGASLGPLLAPFEIFMTRDDIELMLDEAFKRRGAGPTAPPRRREEPAARSGIRSILKRLN
jgi:DNA-binding NarL/FixJ family response regulator